MNTHADKTQENKSLPASTSFHMEKGDKTISRFVNNRSAIHQQKIQEIANSSPQVSQLKAFQNLANNSAQTRQALQLQMMANNYSALHSQPVQKKENNTGLPDNLKTGMENLSGISLDDVKVHRNSDKPAQLQAHAYAQGTNIHLAPGHEKHLPHEAWHVVQQKQGRVKPTMQLKGRVSVNDDQRLEKEADVMGQTALKTEANGSSLFNKQISGEVVAQGVFLNTGAFEWYDDKTGKQYRQVSDVVNNEVMVSNDTEKFIIELRNGVWDRKHTPLDIRDYLHNWNDDETMEVDEPLSVGQSLQKDSPVIIMPNEMVGDLAERLILEWVGKLGIHPYSEQNSSGHGLDLFFKITRGQIKTLPQEIQESLFKSLLHSPATVSKSGRKIKSNYKEPSDNTKYVVILEIKANQAQLSKAQRDSYKYVYKQSKTGFGLRIQEAIEEGYAELFFETRVNIEADQTDVVEFDFIRREKNSGLEGPLLKNPINYVPEQPLSYINSKILGDAGEQYTMEQLYKHGYTSIGSLQKSGGQGVDIVAISPTGLITFFEVKTHLGEGKEPSLTKREKKQYEFVTEILFNIINGTNGYDKVPEEIHYQAWEIYNAAIHHDLEEREKNNEPVVGLSGVNTHQIVYNHIKNLAQYFVVNVDFPNLGQTGMPNAVIKQWGPPKE